MRKLETASTLSPCSFKHLNTPPKISQNGFLQFSPFSSFNPTFPQFFPLPKKTLSLSFPLTSAPMVSSSLLKSKTKPPPFIYNSKSPFKYSMALIDRDPPTAPRAISYGGALDMCFDGNALEIARLIGDMAFQFDKGVEITVNKERILDCVAIGPSESLGIASNIIGNFHQQNHWVEFDLEQRIVPTLYQLSPVFSPL